MLSSTYPSMLAMARSVVLRAPSLTRTTRGLGLSVMTLPHQSDFQRVFAALNIQHGARARRCLRQRRRITSKSSQYSQRSFFTIRSQGDRELHVPGSLQSSQHHERTILAPDLLTTICIMASKIIHIVPSTLSSSAYSTLTNTTHSRTSRKQPLLPTIIEHFQRAYIENSMSDLY